MGIKMKAKGLLRKVEESAEFWAELFKLEFIHDISTLMEKQGVTQKTLAQKIGSSGAYISKVLNGYENLSIHTMAKIANALGAAPHVHVAPKDLIVEWRERSSSEIRTEVSFGTDMAAGGRFYMGRGAKESEVQGGLAGQSAYSLKTVSGCQVSQSQGCMPSVN